MNATKVAEFVSLLLTTPTIHLGALVLWRYGRVVWGSVKAALRRFNSQPLSDRDRLIVGILIGFSGDLVDNFYWGIAWTSSFLGLEMTPFWFANGVWSNIPSRQLAGIAAAIFHLWPVLTDKQTGRRYIYQIASTTLLGGFLLIYQKVVI